MRSRHKNRAVKLLTVGILMIVALVVLVALRKHGIPTGVIAVGAIVLGIGGTIFYIQGCMALAEARGYSGGIVAGVVVAAYFLSMIGGLLAPAVGLVFLGILFLIPVILVVGFKDKYKSR